MQLIRLKTVWYHVIDGIVMVIYARDHMDRSVAILAQEFWSATAQAGLFALAIDLASASIGGFEVGWLASIATTIRRRQTPSHKLAAVYDNLVPPLGR